MARGDIVGWLNSDDLYLPQTISMAVESFQSHPDVGMVYSNCLEIDSRNEVLGVRRVGQYDLIELLTLKIIPQPTVFVRRSIVMALGGLNQCMHYLFDHDLWVRVASVAPILYQNQIWAAARFHGDSKNSKQWSCFSQEANSLLKRASTDPRIGPIMNNHRKEIEAGIASFHGNYALVNGDLRCAIYEFGKAIKLCPNLIGRLWKQFVLAAVLTTGQINTGEKFHAFRRRYHALTSRHDLAPLLQQHQTKVVRSAESTATRRAIENE